MNLYLSSSELWKFPLPDFNDCNALTISVKLGDEKELFKLSKLKNLKKLILRGEVYNFNFLSFVGFRLTELCIDRILINNFTMLYHCTSLENLYASRTNIGYWLKVIARLPKLKVLNCIGIGFPKKLFSNCNKYKPFFPSLKELTLCESKLTNNHLREISSITSLEYLDISSTKISDLSPLNLKVNGISHLRKIILCNTLVDVNQIKNLEKHSNLKVIEVSDNKRKLLFAARYTLAKIKGKKIKFYMNEVRILIPPLVEIIVNYTLP